MPAFSSRVLSSVSISGGATMDLGTALDLINFTTLEIAVEVSVAASGDAPTFLVQHAAHNAAESYVSFSTPVSVDLRATGTSWFHVPAFTRWIAWSTTGTTSDAAVVSLDIIARE